MTWRLTGPTRAFALTMACGLTAFHCFAAELESPFPLEEVRAAAASGQPGAQFKMGDYFYTQGDFTNAVGWYQLAAHAGHRGAQISLATCYVQGRGVAKDLATAGKWSAQARGEADSRELASAQSEEEAGEAANESKEPAHATRYATRGLERIQPELESIQLRFANYPGSDY